jgi:ribonuclease HI
VTFNEIQLYSDGGSKGNPGPGAIGVLVCDAGNQLLHEYSECIGHCTNNTAEYKALIKALDLAAMYTRRKVTVHCDSELLVMQMTGAWRLKKSHLRDLYHQVKDRERMFDSVIYQHTPRINQRISHADRINKQAQNGQPVDKSHVAP